MQHWSPWWHYIGMVALLGAGGKLLAVAASGVTKHEDGGKVFAAIPLDIFTRVLFATVGLVLLAFGLFTVIMNFGPIF